MLSSKNASAFEAVLVRQCAPTLAGMKAGSVFCFRYGSPELAREKVRQWDERLSGFGMSVRVLAERPGSTTIYVYRRKQLEQILADGPCLSFLRRSGYVPNGPDGLLEQLAHRLRTQADFPHELGLFLGYPLRDVLGFIENQGRNFSCSGYWKSYGDPAESRACFDCYRQCICSYVRLFEQGVSIEALAVPA